MRLAFVIGTRPDIIKTAPLIFAAKKTGVDFFVIHTGQHYNPEMDSDFFTELGLDNPDIRLAAGGRPYAEQVAYLLRELAIVFQTEKPTAVVLQGDTVTVMASALAAHKVGIPIVHHEAGIRSRDPSMSEEYHRIITDHLSTLLCAPTEEAVKNLQDEGVPIERLHLTGNTIADALRLFSDKAKQTSSILAQHNLQPKKYFVLTFHRAENVDVKERFLLCMQALTRIHNEHPDHPIVFPVHPRVEKCRQKYGVEWPAGLSILPPLGYLDMLQLTANADLMLTDSGGLQEECSFLGVPCVTLRDSTERPETVSAGVNLIAGLAPDNVSAAVKTMLTKKISPVEIYGNGHAAERIMQLIVAEFSGV